MGYPVNLRADGDFEEVPVATGSGAFLGYTPVSATALLLTSAHHARILVLTATSHVAITIANNGLPGNFYCRILMVSATGWFSVKGATGVTLTTTMANRTSVKTVNVPADLYAIGNGTYLLDGRRLDVAYLLDGLSVQSALAVSAGRRLTETYGGTFMEVRRSSDQAEQLIPFDDDTLSQSSLTAFVGSAHGYVKTLCDQSGNARHFAQATPANQPRIVTSGVVETNAGRVGLRSFVSGTWLDAPLSVTTPAFTAVVVGSLNNASSTFARLLSAGADGQADYGNNAYAAVLNRNSNASQIRTERGGGSYGVTDVTYGALFMYVARWDGTTLTTYVNGSQVSSSAVNNPFNFNLLRLMADTGNTAYWDGYLCEALLFTSALSSTDMALISADQKAFYGI